MRSGLRHGEAHLVELRKGGASPALHQPCAGTASFFDRSYDGANHQYGYTLANETSYASLTFTYAQLTAALSDPTQDTRWFSGRSPNPSFLHPTTFLGDYSGIAATASGGVVALWTEMRESVTFGGRTGTTEDAYFGAQ